MNVSKRFYFLLFLFLGTPSLFATVGLVVPGQSLWWIVQRIAQTTDIIESKVCLLESVVDTIENCSPIPVSSADIAAGTITLSTAGTYCLTEDVTANVTISGDCISFNLNNHCVTGVFSITSDDVEVQNGRVTPPAPTSAPAAALTITAASDRAQIDHLLIICADTATSGVAGRAGIEIHSNDTQVFNTTIKSGNGGDSGSVAGSDAGNGFFIEAGANNAVIKNCIVSTGNGGTTTVGALAGGDGGNGFSIEEDATETEITDCTVLFTGNGGDGGGSGTGGDGGHCVFVASTALDTVVRTSTLRSTGAGGTGSTPGTGGRAVEDLVVIVANLSMIYSNFAHNIGNTVRYNLQAAGVEQGVALANPPTATVVNSFANVFVS